jgi:predicted metalloprotease with PDZ domain
MDRIEKGLHAHHAAATPSPNAVRVSRGQEDPVSIAAERSPQDMVGLAFAKINTITAQGPAGRAGLKIGDLIINFGSVTRTDHDRLNKIAELVGHNEDVSIVD